jgi:hypothetical protein
MRKKFVVLSALLALGLGLWADLAQAQYVAINGVQQSFRVGPALDTADGFTPKTALTPSSFTVNLYKRQKPGVAVTIATCVFATSTLTSDATIQSNNDTITIGTTVYTYKTTLTGAANEIKAVTSASVTLDNTKCAINDSGCSEGTDYGTGTVANPDVTAGTKTATTLVITARVPGTALNALATTETSSHLSWTGSTLASGIDNCMVHEGNGFYWLALPAASYDTDGAMRATFNISGAVPFWENFSVMRQADFDLNYAGVVSTVQGFWDRPSSAMTVDGSIGKLNVDSFAELKARSASVSYGTAQAGGNTSITLAAAESGTNSINVGDIIIIKGGTGIYQTAYISAYVGSTQVATTYCPAGTAGAWITNPDSSSQYVIYPFSYVSAGVITSVTGAVGSVTGGMGGNVAGSIGSVASGGITSASLAADAITASKVAQDVGEEFATALLDLPNGIETSFTLRAFQRLMGATLFGKVSGVDNNTPAFRDVNDTKVRVQAITNQTGRVSMTLDPN